VTSHSVWLLVAVAAAIVLGGCAAATPAPTVGPKPTATWIPIPTATPRPTATVTPTPVHDSVAAARAARLGRGVNLGNALEGPSEGEWGMVIEDAFFPLIAEAGFQTVRVPIRWSAHAAAAAPYTVDPVFFERIDHVMTQALASDLNVVINMHHYDELFASPDEHADRFVAIWEQIAGRYEGMPDTVYFELLNEPHDRLTTELWNPLLARVVSVVREIDDHHTLVITGADWGGLDGLERMVVPEGETNAIATFHSYDPMIFTHQGASWVGPEIGTLGVTWPGPPEHEIELVGAARETEWVAAWFLRYRSLQGDANPASRAALATMMDRAAAWRERKGIPVWLGEFGAYETADIDSRVRWTTAMREEAEDRGIPWAYWEFGAGFGVYDREAGAWREELQGALIPPGGE